jgi:hypothetical protein
MARLTDRQTRIARALGKCIQVTHEIECDTCGTGEHEENGSDWSAACTFTLAGWDTDANGFARCKKCNDINDEGAATQ